MGLLDEKRKKINEIDEEMAKLFKERMKTAKEIAEIKKENALPIFDPLREKEILASHQNDMDDNIIQEYYVLYLQAMMDISKRYQSRIIEGIKVAYCGVEGAFAHIAAQKMFTSGTYISYPSFSSAYQAVEKGECDICVLPLENSYAGDVGAVMDLIFSGSLYINQVCELFIEHNLLGKESATEDKIKTVMSHPQALLQCSEYIEQKGFKTIEYPNTAMASLALSESNDETIGVIASKESATLYNLKILKEHIQTNHNNSTRFAAFSRVLRQPNALSRMGEHFVLVFTVLNEAGSLAKTLNIIGAHGFNMRNVRSRPMKSLMWNYFFFVELEGNINSQDGKDMLNELKTVCDCLKLVGTYYEHAD
ncbi:MAG: chorismate mutase [Bacilli bacterium]